MVAGWLTSWTVAPVPCGLLVVVLGLYASGVMKLRRRGKRWSWRRATSFFAAWVVLGLALCSPIAVHDEVFPLHMLQHLLLGMLAPLLFALSAPVTLALSALSPGARRQLLRLLRSKFVTALAFPPVAGLIYVASMWVLYLTPLFALTLRHPLLHEALHAHFMLAGCLFMWPLIGLDPIRHRGSLHLRVGVLVFALGSHAALAKLLYAGWMGGGLATSLPTRDIHAGAELMYYGGDLIDVALLIAFFAQWYARGGRLLTRDKRTLARASVQNL